MHSKTKGIIKRLLYLSLMYMIASRIIVITEDTAPAVAPSIKLLATDMLLVSIFPLRMVLLLLYL